MNTSDDPASRSRLCPRCQHSNLSEMLLCNECGTPLDSTPTPDHAHAQRTSSSSGMLDATAVSCPRCGVVNTPETTICACGYSGAEQLICVPETESNLPRPRGAVSGLEERKSSEREMEWSYAVGEDVFGPFSEDQMAQLIQSGEIGRETIVWNPTLPGWIEARASTLAARFTVPPPIPSQSRSAAALASPPPPQVHSPQPQDPLTCPTCSQKNMVQKVSAVYSGGTSTNTTTSLGIGLAGSLASGGPSLLGGGIGASTGTSQTRLAALLAPPRLAPQTHWLQGCVGLLFAAVTAVAGYATLLAPNPLGMLFFVAATGTSLFCFVSAVRSHATCRIQEPRIREAKKRWNQLFLCLRDETVFDPYTGRSAPLTHIKTLLFP